MTSDYTIRYQGKIFQIARGDIRPGLRGGRVRVEQRLDGSMAVKFREYGLSVAECLAQPKTPSPRKPASAPRHSPQGCAQLDERFPSPEESSFGSNSAGRDTGRVADVLWRLTSVALRAPPVSRQRTKSGTFYFAKIRTFLLCLDIQG